MQIVRLQAVPFRPMVQMHAHFSFCRLHSWPDADLQAELQGILPDDYWSEWCNDFFDKGKCPRGTHCRFAHSMQQLRVDKAIQRGKLDAEFKTNFCASQSQRGEYFECSRTYSVMLLLAKEVLLTSCIRKTNSVPTISVYCSYTAVKDMHAYSQHLVLNMPCLAAWYKALSSVFSL